MTKKEAKKLIAKAKRLAATKSESELFTMLGKAVALIPAKPKKGKK